MVYATSECLGILLHKKSPHEITLKFLGDEKMQKKMQKCTSPQDSKQIIVLKQCKIRIKNERKDFGLCKKK